MGIPLSKRANTAIESLRDQAVQATTFMKIAMLLGVAALVLAAVALMRTVRPPAPVIDLKAVS
jgi:hypothetical protein